LRSSHLIKNFRAFKKLLSENLRHIFLKRTGIILLALLAFVNARFTETCHFHAGTPESGQFLKSCESGNSFSQESCSLCEAAHHDISFLKNPEEFFFVKNFTSLPFLKAVFKTTFAILSTSSRAPPALF